MTQDLFHYPVSRLWRLPPHMRSIQKAMELNSNFKHYVIAPEFCDSGVVTATDWVQIRNYTDAALMAACMYEMLVNTFNEDGTIKANAWLDVDYIDTVLYGFFDSPEYWVDYANVDGVPGAISLTEKAGWRKINAVAPGMSYASWLMGDDERLTKALYSNSTNYTAKAYGNMARAAKCALPIKGVAAHSADINSTEYYTKKDYMVAKTPEWAEKICGTPATTIRELAWFFANDDNKPYLTEWSGGLQKGENGVISFWAIQTMFAITKNWGWSVGSMGGMVMGTHGTANPAYLGAIPAGIETLPQSPTPAPITLTNAGSGNPTVPSISCNEHFNGLYMAFKDVLDDATKTVDGKKFEGRSNPFWDGSSRYMNDDAGAKTLVLYKRTAAGNAYDTNMVSKLNKWGTTSNYYAHATDNNGQPIYSGKRMFLGCLGAFLNQVSNPNWKAEIFSKLPLAQDNPDDPDTFCMAIFEPYMSPQVRYADYVFPLAQVLEVNDNNAVGGVPFRRLPLSTPPAEAKNSWDAAFIGWNVAEKLGAFNEARFDGAPDYNKATPTNAAYTAIGSTTPEYVSVVDKHRQLIQAVCNNSGSRFAGMTVEQAIAAQIMPKTSETEASVNIETASKTAYRLEIETYLAGNMAAPFITFTANRSFAPSITNTMGTFTQETKDRLPGVLNKNDIPCLDPVARGEVFAHHGKMACNAEYAVFTFENAYDIYHGWKEKPEERGQANKDLEGDPMLYNIPIYYAFEDAFNETYGALANSPRKNYNAGWYTIGPKPATNDLSRITDRLVLTVGTTHDRYNTHSSQIENPYLRELNHRTAGGGWLSGNDWNEYCVVPAVHTEGSTSTFNPMMSSAIQKKDRATASWKEFWMNDEDAAQFEINDGDLIRVSNPVGAIRAVARVSKRLIRGHGQIHQGGWYDPNPSDGVDDGGCANTLMSDRTSKFDHGNGVQFAYCVVEKETNFF